MKANATADNNQANPMADFTAAALKNYEQAIQTGLKLQAEAGQMWNSMLNQTACSQDWQKGFNKMNGLASDLAPLAQERLTEIMAVVENTSRAGTELMKQAIQASQTPGMADCQAKWMEFWNSSISAARTNTAALAKISSKAVDSWVEFIQKHADNNFPRASKTA